MARRVLCRLPARDRAVLAALFGTDNHMDAVAAQFKMSRAAAYSKWYRLRDRLLQMIEARTRRLK